MGSLDRRIQRLEELYGLDEDPQEKARMQDRGVTSYAPSWTASPPGTG